MATATKEKLQRARVLVDCIPLGVKAGQVVEAAPGVIKAHAAELDPAPAAVAYALKESAQVVTVAAAPADESAGEA